MLCMSTLHLHDILVGVCRQCVKKEKKKICFVIRTVNHNIGEADLACYRLSSWYVEDSKAFPGYH